MTDFPSKLNHAENTTKTTSIKVECLFLDSKPNFNWLQEQKGTQKYLLVMVIRLAEWNTIIQGIIGCVPSNQPSTAQMFVIGQFRPQPAN